MKACDVYQMGDVNPTAGWEDQPPLVYVTAEPAAEMVAVLYSDGRPAMLPVAEFTPERYRGNVLPKHMPRAK